MAATLSLLAGLTNTVIANESEALVARHERSDMRDRQMAAPDVAMLIRATSLDCFVARAPRSDEGGVWMSARGAVIASASEAIQRFALTLDCFASLAMTVDMKMTAPILPDGQIRGNAVQPRAQK
jgi:hypothetical protein